jgi:hypothetical protein
LGRATGDNPFELYTYIHIRSYLTLYEFLQDFTHPYGPCPWWLSASPSARPLSKGGDNSKTRGKKATRRHLFLCRKNCIEYHVREYSRPLRGALCAVPVLPQATGTQPPTPHPQSTIQTSAEHTDASRVCQYFCPSRILQYSPFPFVVCALSWHTAVPTES